jgi:hypothetical protein
MTQAVPTGNGRPSRRWRAGRVLGGVAFALTPWLTLGFGTPIAFILAAVLFSYLGKVHAAVLWLSAAVYTAAFIVELAESGAASGTTGDHVFSTCLLITMVVGGLQALAFAVVAGANGYRPVRGRAARDAATEADPAVRTPARPQPVAAAGFPPPVRPDRRTAQQPVDVGTQPTATFERRGHAPLIASLVCFALSAALFVVPVLVAQRAEASDPGSGEGYGFIAVLSIFPCIAAVVLLVVAAVQLSRKALK